MTDRPIIFSGLMVRALIEGWKTQTRQVLKPSTTWFDGGPWQSHHRAAQWDWENAWVDPGPSPIGNSGPYLKLPFAGDDDDWGFDGSVHRIYPRTQPDDLLWVREKHWIVEIEGGGIGCPHLLYDDEWSDGPGAKMPQPKEERIWFGPPYDETPRFGARPSIHMPRWASRLTLTVTDVKVERLQDISDGDVEAEAAVNGLIDWDCPYHHDGCKCGESTYQEVFARLWNDIHGPDAWDANPWIVALTFTVEQRNIDESQNQH